MVSKTRTELFLESESNKTKVVDLLKDKSMTRQELCEATGASKMQMHNLLKRFTSLGYLKTNRNGEVCSVTGRAMSRYALTDLVYIPKDIEALKERTARNRVYRERRAAQGPRAKKDPLALPKEPLRTEPVAVKVNEHTTMYFNSRRPQSDFKLKKEDKSRRNSKVAIGSGMSMFGNW